METQHVKGLGEFKVIYFTGSCKDCCLDDGRCNIWYRENNYHPCENLQNTDLVMFKELK